MENQPLTRSFTAATDLNTARGIDGVTVVTWGDSIANFIGINLRHVFNNVINIGRNGAGLDNVIPALPIKDIPKSAAVIMSMGGNDIEGLIGQPQEKLEDYAQRVIQLALQVRADGAEPVILGHAAPPAPYTGPVPGGVSRWHEPSFFEKWIATMHRLNAAVENAAKDADIPWSPVEGRIPLNERAQDNLHYTTRGSRRIAQNALADAGIRV
ncbi:MAG TPA: SGNH/GDSL hydrolase family protein [Patescibacteria group bacterium]|nr:SGNH/GDSL hydrolase family protein [Patescibacteria group bacterium]